MTVQTIAMRIGGGVYVLLATGTLLGHGAEPTRFSAAVLMIALAIMLIPYTPRPRPKPDSPDVFLQWKNIGNVCLDLQCTCSDPDEAYEFHLDHDILWGGLIRCPRCLTVWKLGDPEVTRLGPSDYWWTPVSTGAYRPPHLRL
ncbi:MAG: hypothetical protein OSB43_04640 [Nocardioides sp.]|uniref:hypothetical protein n=1 Tax=Nocardioides sp. TaxID=35761 RepID=UPI0023919708|nr:hypothetical protein [Nocardioides sp.]MDE0775546.1 hypothetical protein [Nocardioides sp.]